MVKVISSACGQALLQTIDKLAEKASGIEPNLKNLTLDVAGTKQPQTAQ